MSGYGVRGVPPVSVLYVEADSVYSHLGVDVWPLARDANSYPGPFSVVAHPPCTGYCRMHYFSSPDSARDACAFRARDFVRSFGGVMEHPAFSRFWSAGGLPRPGEGFDDFGGWTLPLDQIWFGYPVRKPTWLYICGVAPREVPLVPLSFAPPLRRGFELMGRKARSATPEAFAVWLVSLARLVPGDFGGSRPSAAVHSCCT